MKNTIVFCIMTLCISVFLLCSGCRDAYTAKEQQINIREYSCSIPQIALDKNEMILDVNEEESQLRFTIGVTSDELKRKEVSDSSGTVDDRFIFIGKFVDTQDSDDILKIMVLLQDHQDS